jgi:hypothetical protein
LALEVTHVDLSCRFEKVRTETIGGLFEQYKPETGDLVFLGAGDDLMAYACAPTGWELVKFGAEWKSPA